MKIDVILPPGRHSWNLTTGWVNTLRRMQILGGVFHCDEHSADDILKYAASPESDMIILLGGDHHMACLHNTPQKQDIWRKTRVPKVAFCFDSILDTYYPATLAKSATAAAAFTHFIHCDEKDSEFFAEKHVPSLWLPQCVDETAFKPGEFSRRRQVFFRGKLDMPSPYSRRDGLLSRLRQLPEFVHIENELTHAELTKTYQSFLGAINLPGGFHGYNTRTFEALAAGNILFQSEIPDRPKNNALFNKSHLITFSDSATGPLLANIKDVMAHPAEFEVMAMQGREECLAKHTITRRIEQLIEFVSSSYHSAVNLHIGCGTNILPDSINVDLVSHDPRVVIQDLATLSDIPDFRFERVYASNVLGYFPRQSIKEVLNVWVSKLRAGGRLFLSVPDMRFLSLAHILGAPLDKILPPAYGTQGSSSDFRYTGFDRKSLTSLLTEVGLEDIRLYDPNEFEFTQWDSSRQPLYLNITARKAGTQAEQTQGTQSSRKIVMRRYTSGLRKFLRKE